MMKRPLIAFALVPLGLWAIFVLPDLLAGDPNFWNGRRAVVILSGVLALWWMSAGMVLAARPAWLEKRLGGLDKLYRWHKYLGIGSGTLVFCHWMAEWLPKKLAKLGWLPPRVRGPKGTPDMWLDLAKEVGEWAGYILLALVVVALVKRIPYRWFRLVHKALALVFLAGVFHGLMMLPAAYWQQPLGWLTAALAAAGVLPALLSLAGRIGRQRRHPAVIEVIRQYPGQLLEIVCRPPAGWPGHLAGQFLFIDFGQPGEGPHPFTIASAWKREEGTLTLAIKALGDFTRQLPASVRPGQSVVLEGPYGAFDFAPESGDHQVWIAGGIGITPFLARLDELARDKGATTSKVDFFYSTPDAGATDFPSSLAERCAAAGVRLHRRLTDRDGPLAPPEIAALLRPGSSVWFCGPSAWGKSLGRALRERGLPSAAFHQEAFEFR